MNRYKFNSCDFKTARFRFKKKKKKRNRWNQKNLEEGIGTEVKRSWKRF